MLFRLSRHMMLGLEKVTPAPRHQRQRHCHGVYCEYLCVLRVAANVLSPFVRRSSLTAGGHRLDEESKPTTHSGHC